MTRARHRAAPHPVREAVLALLEYEGEMSVTQMTDRMADFVEPPPQLGVVAYHVRTLDGKGKIRLVRVEKARGSLAHYYELAS